MREIELSAREAFAIRSLMNVMHAIGVTAHDKKSAEQAIELAAKCLSFILEREVTAHQLVEKMRVLVDEERARERPN
jgi:hypothetical protein